MKQRFRSKKGARPVAKKEVPSPTYRWEKEGYEREQEMTFILPWQFLFMCRLVEVKPYEVLHRLQEDLGQENWLRKEDRSEAQQLLVEYFIRQGWGQTYYTETELRQMFTELRSISLLWPKDAPMELIDLQARWRDAYRRYWLKKWYRKVRRKQP